MVTCVAVVDDDRELSSVLCAILTDEGYRAVPVLASDTALDVLALSMPDLIIQDLHFGGTNAGIALLASLRQDSILATIPVIICSADVFAIREHHDEFQQYGYRVVSKPFDIDDLLAAVHAALGSST